MTYAYARATGDGGLITRYYSLLTSWADYLSNSTLVIHDQSSADGLTTKNQTNLAIKGIIAIEAMSKMSSVVKQTADADKYSTTATRLYSQWKGLALASDQHLFAAYGQVDSWTLGYNLFADAWLDTGVVEPSVFEGQSSFIENVTLTSGLSNFGLPVDSLNTDPNVAISSWNLFVAAMTSNQDLRTNLISRVHNRASFNASSGVFPLSYDSTEGSTILGAASPAQGAMYAPLALKAPVFQIATNTTATPTTTPKVTTTSSSSKATSHTGAIAGGIGGSVAALIVVVGTVAFVRLRRRQDRFHESNGSSSSGAAMEVGPEITVTPFDQTPGGAAPLPPSQRAALLPVGLSGKELARLRSEAARPPPTCARLLGGSQPTNFPTIRTTERNTRATPPQDTRRLQT
ncbi:hypothetical protein EDB85DRAFT_2152001 [Lactarius pseudohatsudake]|nr:hypothetical protein EDB85DRAFT_2152001 [Lactarius pseudohatsudake]